MITIEEGNIKIGELISQSTPFIAGKMGAVVYYGPTTPVPGIGPMGMPYQIYLYNQN